MGELVVCFVDVGQGDCTIALDSALKRGIVVDCPSGAHLTAISEIERLGCRWIDAAVITHGHADHAGGVLDVLEALAERFQGRIYVNADTLMTIPSPAADAPSSGKKVRAMFNRLREFRGRVSHAEQGEEGAFGVLKWTLLSPTYDEIIDAVGLADPNLASAIVALSDPNLEVVVGSDAPLSTWERVAPLIRPGGIVRWPHHGGAIGGKSAFAMQSRLFKIVTPATIILSVGKDNTHRHPSRGFLKAQAASGIPMACTQSTPRCPCPGATVGRCDGSIVVTSDLAGMVVFPETPQIHAQQ